MPNNICIIDRNRMDDSSLLYSVKVMMFLDFVVARENDGTYSVLKNRHSGGNYKNISKDELDGLIRVWSKKYE